MKNEMTLKSNRHIHCSGFPWTHDPHTSERRDVVISNPRYLNLDFQVCVKHSRVISKEGWLWSLLKLEKAPEDGRWDHRTSGPGTASRWLCGLGGLLNLSGFSILICSIRGWIKPFVVLPAPSVTSLDGYSQCDQHDKNLPGKVECYPES